MSEAENLSKLIPCLDKHTEQQLIRAANETALRFMAPIYLCGSAVDSKDPLDIDIFMVVTERQFKRLMRIRTLPHKDGSPL
jgi:hypothetical protein